MASTGIEITRTIFRSQSLESVVELFEKLNRKRVYSYWGGMIGFWGLFAYLSSTNPTDLYASALIKASVAIISIVLAASFRCGQDYEWREYARLIARLSGCHHISLLVPLAKAVAPTTSYNVSKSMARIVTEKIIEEKIIEILNHIDADDIGVLTKKEQSMLWRLGVSDNKRGKPRLSANYARALLPTLAIIGGEDILAKLRELGNRPNLHATREEQILFMTARRLAFEMEQRLDARRKADMLLLPSVEPASATQLLRPVAGVGTVTPKAEKQLLRPIQD